MAGKLAIAVTAVIIGSSIGEAGLPGVKDIFSGAFKILRHLQNDNESPKASKASTSKPKTDTLLDQVNSLRQELQQFASSRPITIVTTGSGGAITLNRVKVVVVVGAVGYLYIRWKGWKISDMMFVTRRSLSDASAAVGKQLEQVQSSVVAAKRFLSTRIDRVDIRLDECKEITEATRDEVQGLHGDITAFQEEMQSVHLVVQTLETKLGRLEMSQDMTTRGISELCKYASRLEQDRSSDKMLGASTSSSRPALESAKSMPANMKILQAASLPPITLDSPSPTSSPSAPAETPPTVPTPKVHRSTTLSETFLKELKGVASPVGPVLSRSNSVKPGLLDLSNGSSASSQSAELSNGNSSGNSRFGIRLPGINVFSRNRSPAN